jgi:hypothetical protein
MDARENEEEVENVGSEDVRVSTECEKGNGSCKYTEAERDDTNGKHSKAGEGE